MLSRQQHAETKTSHRKGSIPTSQKLPVTRGKYIQRPPMHTHRRMHSQPNATCSRVSRNEIRNEAKYACMLYATATTLSNCWSRECRVELVQLDLESGKKKETVLCYAEHHDYSLLEIILVFNQIEFFQESNRSRFEMLDLIAALTPTWVTLTMLRCQYFIVSEVGCKPSLCHCQTHLTSTGVKDCKLEDKDRDLPNGPRESPRTRSFYPRTPSLTTVRESSKLFLSCRNSIDRFEQNSAKYINRNDRCLMTTAVTANIYLLQFYYIIRWRRTNKSTN